jgi:hypothetical protein
MVVAEMINTDLTLSIPSSTMTNTASKRKVIAIEKNVTIANHVENSPNSLGAKILVINRDPIIGIDWANNVPKKTDDTCFQKIFIQYS